MTMRGIRIALWGVVGIVGVLVVTIMIGSVLEAANHKAPMSGTASIGGPFSMLDQDGRPVTEADFAGKPRAMFFGFTSCPDVCPTMLMEMTGWLERLGPLAERIQPIFVSVDPERDTPEVIKEYLSVFDPRITGLTGTPEQVAEFAENYGVYYEKVPTGDDDYTMNHTAGVLLFDASGGFRGMADYHENPKDAEAKLRRLAEDAGGGNA